MFFWYLQAYLRACESSHLTRLKLKYIFEWAMPVSNGTNLKTQGSERCDMRSKMNIITIKVLPAL